jgi:hypothetical protein
MFSLVFYCPDSHVEAVKTAVFAAGAGRIGAYDQCCWQTLGRGQFRALDGANPAIGSLGVLEHLDEWRVEMVVDAGRVEDVRAALLKSHPYETPAFHFIEMAGLGDLRN